MIVRFTTSTRRHRIGRARVRYVLDHTAPVASVPGPSGESRMLWVGPDDRGVELEVIAVVLDDDTLPVLHVTPTALRGGT